MVSEGAPWEDDTRTQCQLHLSLPDSQAGLGISFVWPFFLAPGCLAQPLFIHVALDNLISLSLPQFPHQSNGGSTSILFQGGCGLPIYYHLQRAEIAPGTSSMLQKWGCVRYQHYCIHLTFISLFSRCTRLWVLSNPLEMEMGGNSQGSSGKTWK